MMRIFLRYFISVLAVVALVLGGIDTQASSGEVSGGDLELYFLNVGQGDGILIRTPDNHFGLIDVGKGDRILSLLSGILPSSFSGFDFVVGSHSDLDHIGGLDRVLLNYSVGTVFWNDGGKKGSVVNRIENSLRYSDAGRVSLYAGDVVRVGCCLLINTLWPNVDTLENQNIDENDKSIGVLLRYGDFEMYSAGDLGGSYEYMSAQKVTKTSINVEVCKIGHHGSNSSTSTEFLKVLRPQVAVIQVGENSYGHPNQEVLDLLHLYGVDIMRNDLDGTIRISTDGDQVSIYTGERLVNQFHSR